MVISSGGGVQQGDPLGPLLFAAAIQPMALQLRTSLDLGLFFLDDGGRHPGSSRRLETRPAARGCSWSAPQPTQMRGGGHTQWHSLLSPFSRRYHHLPERCITLRKITGTCTDLASSCYRFMLSHCNCLYLFYMFCYLFVSFLSLLYLFVSFCIFSYLFC